jgi:asparagine synthetase B (glutamine-hydrolysing)
VRTVSERISLSQWHARFSWRDTSYAGAEAGVAANARRAGPFTLYRGREGCDVATFGDPSSPGTLLFDGYLFERSALQRELGLAPGTRDGALAAAAYVRWGLAAFDRLDGSYLVAIWDARDRRLLIAHDPLGHHPVFYADQHDTICFTSNVLSLPASGAVRRQPHRVSLALAALQYWPAAGQTFFEDVRRLRAGHYLSATAPGIVREVHYWSPWLDDEEPGLTERDAREQFEPTLVSAIGRCMELIPDGIMLSGGLDSVTIAALAADYAKAHNTPLVRAVSGRRDWPHADEEAMQSAVTAALGMDHLVTYESEWVGTRSKIELSLDAVRDLPGPSRIWWVGAYMRFYRFAADRGVAVALTGSGGDNWVSVADAFAAHAMRTLDVRGLVRHMRSWTGTGGLTFKAAANHLLWSGGARILLDTYAARWMPALKHRYHLRRSHRALPAWLCPDAQLREELVETLVGQRPPALAGAGRVPRNIYRHAQRSPVNPYYQYEFEVGFHVESDSGVRLLSPYHDRQLVRFLNSIPPQVLLEGASYKGMLRPLAERRLPGLGLTAQRKIYAAAVRDAQLRELASGVREQWPGHRLETLAALGIVDARAVRDGFASPANGSSYVAMYALMSADRWTQVHAAP